MKKFGQVIGFLIFLVSVIVGGGIITGALPANFFVWDAFSIFCDDDTHTVSKNNENIQCVDAEGEIESNITGNVAFTTIVLTLIFGTIGFVMLLRYAPPRDPQVLSDKFDRFAEQRNLQRVHTHITAEEKEALKTLNTAQGNLTSRLKELDDAYAQKLISTEEYEKTRQSILSNLSD